MALLFRQMLLFPRMLVYLAPKALPIMPLWLSLDLCVPLRLEDSYTATCRSLRISA